MVRVYLRPGTFRPNRPNAIWTSGARGRCRTKLGPVPRPPRPPPPHSAWLCLPVAGVHLARVLYSASRAMVERLALTSGLVLLFAYSVAAHKHHDELTEEQANAPVDTILWLHIFLQAAVWGVLFPTGMVLGLSRSRWHVPLQVRRIPAVSSCIC